MKRVLQFLLNRLPAYIYKPLQMHGRFFVWMYLLGFLCIMLINPFGKHVAVFELFLDLYLLTALLTLLPHKVASFMKALLSIVFYALALVDVFCLWRFGSPMGPAFLFNCLQTDIREAGEALNTFLSWRVFLSPVMLVVLLGVAHFLSRHVRVHRFPRFLNDCWRGRLTFLLLAVCLPMSWVNIKFLYHYYFVVDESLEMEYALQRPYTTGFYLPVYRFAEGVKAWQIHRRQVTTLIQRVEATTVDSCSFRSPQIVLIIGESFNRHHAQLYGYPLPTTPWQLQAEKDSSLVAFTDVVAPFHQTSEVFKTLFSLYAYGCPRSWDDYTLFPALFKKAGYQVFFLTNQFVRTPEQDIWDFSGGSILNDERLSAAQFSHRNNRMHDYDDGLLEDYDSLKGFRSQHNLIIFHLLGQHFNYQERYPSSARRFMPEQYRRDGLSQADREVLADYDNATLYNDRILKRITECFLQEDAIVVYVPDHGELMFDGSSTFGRSFEVKSRNEVYQQFEIPFWIWMSPLYRQSHPQIAEEVRKAKEKPFMTDNLDQLLLYLAGISCSDYRAEDNPLVPQYNSRRQRLLMGTMDYDKVMRRKSQ